MAAWDEDLPTIDMEAIPAFYAGQHTDARDLTIGLAGDRRHSRRAERRKFLHMLAVGNAAKHLAELPAAGETLHCIMAGNYHAWDVVPAVARLIQPATIKSLHVATLGFNRDNAEELVALLDAGTIRRVAFICSHYFKSVDAEVFAFLHQQLTQRGHRMAAIRCHAKILLFETTDRRALVVESSANLRSCRNIEQFTLTHDAPLLAFHRDWMETVLAQLAPVKERPCAAESPSRRR